MYILYHSFLINGREVLIFYKNFDIILDNAYYVYKIMSEDIMRLTTLFTRCISVPYVRTGVSADYAVQRQGNLLNIFFQDSYGVEDWKNNLNFPAKPYKRMGRTVWLSHRGFLKVWKEIEPIVSEYILDKSVKNIVVVGYSHGAAIAVFCHEYVWYNRPDLRDKIEGYGFGCPRVFWGLKTSEMRERWERFTVIRNIDDIVTHLPPVVFGYRHVGKMMRIGGRGKYSRVEAHFKENMLRELVVYENKEKTRKIPVFLKDV